MGQPIRTPVNLHAAQRPVSDHLTISGLLVGGYLAVFLCKSDNCMWVLGKLSFRPQFPLLASLGMLAIVLWYCASGKVSRLLKGCRGFIMAFALIAWISLVGAVLPDANFTNGGVEVIKPTIDFLLFLFAFPLAILFVSTANWKLTCGLALCGSVISIVVDAVSPGTFSTLDNRPAGFGVNANMGAAQTGLLLIGVLDWKRPSLSLTNCGWCLWAFMGVFMTLSRSGILLLAIVWTMYACLSLRRNGVWTVVLLGGLACGVGGYALTDAEVAKNVLPMLDSTHSRMKLFTGEFDAIDTSEDARLTLVHEYVDLISEHPILGWGTGYNAAAQSGSHNMFLTRWVDNGIFSVGAYIFLIGMLCRVGITYQSWECVAIAINLAGQSFFSHNLLEDNTLLFMMAISAGRAVLIAPLPALAKNAIGGSGIIPYPRSSPLAKAG